MNIQWVKRFYQMSYSAGQWIKINTYDRTEHFFFLLFTHMLLSFGRITEPTTDDVAAGAWPNGTWDMVFDIPAVRVSFRSFPVAVIAWDSAFPYPSVAGPSWSIILSPLLIRSIPSKWHFCFFYLVCLCSWEGPMSICDCFERLWSSAPGGAAVRR